MGAGTGPPSGPILCNSYILRETVQKIGLLPPFRSVSVSDAIDPHDDVLAAVPDTADLARGLAAVLPAAELPPGGVEVLDRELNDFARTFPSEFVTYRRADGRAGEL